MLGDIISVGRLVEARRVAMRRGVWFRALDRVERAMVDLTIRCVDRIRSPRLARMVTAILIKLRLAMDSPAKWMVRTLGPFLAMRVARIAQGWGNRSAAGWAWNPEFVWYLAIMHINTPGMFRT